MKWPRQRMLLREIKKSFPHDTVTGCPLTLPLFNTDTLNKGKKWTTAFYFFVMFFMGQPVSHTHFILDFNLTVRFTKSSIQKPQWFLPWLVSDKGKLGLQNVQV